jgi:hypothetical protein
MDDETTKCGYHKRYRKFHVLEVKWSGAEVQIKAVFMGIFDEVVPSRLVGVKRSA